MPTDRSPRAPAMTATRLGFARTGAHLGLVVSVGVTIAVSVALLCGLAGWIALDTRTALRAAFADEAASYAQVQTRVGEDPELQDAAAAELFTSLFGDTAHVERLDVGEGDSARVAWRITVDAQTLDADRLARLRSGVAALPDAFDDSVVAVRGSQSSGDLGEALEAARVGVVAAAAIAPVPLAVLGVLGWFAVLELARLLGAARGRESVLLSARGISPRQSFALTASESIGVALASSLAGFGLAVGLLAARDGTAGALAVLDTWALALAALIVLAVTLGVQSARAARASASPRAGAGRIEHAATWGAAVLVVLAAALFIWQASATRDLGADDRWRIVVLALAPTLGVTAVAVLSVLLFGMVAGAVARASGARSGISPAYPARQVARRVVAFSTAIALVAIAVSGAILAAGYIGTWRAASDDAARLAAGATLRAVSFETTPSTPGIVSPERIAPAADVAGVTETAPALTAPLVIGDMSASLVALPADALAGVLLSVPGLVDPDAVADALAWDPTSAPLPQNATGLRLTAQVTTSVPEAAETLRAGAWVQDATGTPARIELHPTVVTENEGPGWTLAAEAALPGGTAPWRLLAVDVTRALASQGVTVTVSGAGLAALEPAGVEALDVQPEPSVLLQGWGSGAVSEAVVWSGAGLAPPPTPAVVTDVLAAALGLEQGDDLDARFDGTGRTAALTVAAIVPAVGGASSSSAVMVALDALSQNQLDASPEPGGAPSVVPPNEVWAAGDEGAAGALAEALDARVLTPTDGAAAITSSILPAWWASAIGGAVLAGVALIALLVALAGQRAGEVLVLRALGVTPGGQGRMRVVEASVVVGLAALLGAAGGFFLSRLVVPAMARTAVPGFTAAETGALVIDPWPLDAAVVVLALALAVAAVLAASAIRRQGASTRLEEAAP